MGKRSAALLLLIASCGAPLPSTTPLGEGPKVAAEKQTREREARALEARRSESAPDAGAPSSPSPEPAKPKNAPVAKAEDADADAATPSEADKPGAASKPAGAVVLAGLYAGSDSSTFRLSGMPERTEKDPKAKTRVSDKSDGSVDLIAIDSSNGKDICTLHATPKGKDRKEFTVTPGQHCFESGAGMSLKASAALTADAAQIKETASGFFVMKGSIIKLN